VSAVALAPLLAPACNRLVPGPPAWTSLPDTDPAKLRACLAAALWWALDAEHRQAGEVEASHAVSAPATGEARWTFTAGVSTGRTITTSARSPIWSRRAWRADRRVPGAGEPLTAADCKRASNCAVRVDISLLQVSSTHRLRRGRSPFGPCDVTPLRVAAIRPAWPREWQPRRSPVSGSPGTDTRRRRPVSRWRSIRR
jgi:hypothetical protein